MAGVHGDLVDDFDLVDGGPRQIDGEVGFEEEGSLVEGAFLAGVKLVDGGFDLEGVVVLVFLGVAAEEPELTFGIEVAGVAGVVPDLTIDFGFGFGVTAAVEVAF